VNNQSAGAGAAGLAASSAESAGAAAGGAAGAGAGGLSSDAGSGVAGSLSAGAPAAGGVAGDQTGGNAGIGGVGAAGSSAGSAGSAGSSSAGFVLRTGTSLSLDGKPFRFSGPNIYWLALDENVKPSPSYPTKGRVTEVLAVAQTMGATMVRAHSLGVSVGSSLSVEPSLANFNAAAFEPIDYAINAAHEYGVRLIIPLVDDYDYYTGGKYTFLRWRGLSSGNDFYTNAQVIGDFKAYIAHLLNHVNQYNGVAYKDDPTIAIWETGNELGAYDLKEGAPPNSWTQSIADYIKSIDSQHLVMDGSDGINSAALSIPSVDVYSDHLYPLSVNLLKSDVSKVTAAGKAILIGEYDWTGAHGGDQLTSLLAELESDKSVGDVYWSLFGHDAQCSGYVSHNDGYTLHYPGDNADVMTRVGQLRKHAFQMSGVAMPAATTPACPQPAL